MLGKDDRDGPITFMLFLSFDTHCYLKFLVVNIATTPGDIHCSLEITFYLGSFRKLKKISEMVIGKCLLS